MAIKAKLLAGNERISLHALCNLDSMAKNCGPAFREELADSICAVLYTVTTTTTHKSVFKRILELLETWSTTFRDNPKYVVFRDFLRLLQSSSYRPSIFCDLDDVRCDRRPFTLNTARKYRCTCCGNFCCEACSRSYNFVFCEENDSGRICDGCYNCGFGTTNIALEEPDVNFIDGLSEEFKLQLAIAISLSGGNDAQEGAHGVTQSSQDTTAFPRLYDESLNLDQASGESQQIPPPKPAVCVICRGNQAQNAFIPCGHKALCRECTPNVRDMVPKKCVLCREYWVGIYTIYE
ncbi:hepatocyte growth factor-regulated tyrosine kinase substrate-like isoform X2 [Zophobas morio]